MRGLRLLLFIAFHSGFTLSADLRIVWPTDNTGYFLGEELEVLVQPTISGRAESALFGCVRNAGHRFHEGIDIRALKRDARGEAADPVYAILPGVVRYVNSVAGRSSYGRYVVVEHTGQEPAVLSLYAHLASILPEIRPGAEVSGSQKLGIMGRSAGGYTIPRERAHLHFEIGFWVTDQFQSWYDWRRFPSHNFHGAFNGMNLIGIDPLEFYEQLNRGEITGFSDYIQALPTAFTLRVSTTVIPDFIQRYPALVEGGEAPEEVAGWLVGFTWYGLPKAWVPLRETPEGNDVVEVVGFHRNRFPDPPCRGTLRFGGGTPEIGPHTQRTLQLLFGLR